MKLALNTSVYPESNGEQLKHNNVPDINWKHFSSYTEFEHIFSVSTAAVTV